MSSRKEEKKNAPKVEPVEPTTLAGTEPEPTVPVIVIIKAGGGYVASEVEIPVSLTLNPTWSKSPNSFDATMAAVESHLLKRFIR